MAAPKPFIFLFLIDQGDRLGIMDKNNIPAGVDFIDILIACLHKGLEIPRGYFLASSMQGVMKFLGNLKEPLSAFYNIPTRIYAKLP